MKQYFLLCLLILPYYLFSQNPPEKKDHSRNNINGQEGGERGKTERKVMGIVKDSAGLVLKGVTVKLLTGADSSVAQTNTSGFFQFGRINSKEFDLVFSMAGYQTQKRSYQFRAREDSVLRDTIVLRTFYKQLANVTVTGSKPVLVKEDTLQYSADAYKVRENSVVEDQLKRLPGVEVDQQGNVNAQGKQVTKVRVNGKDFFGGDVKTATKNIPAELVDNYQIIDDYGDLANMTGIKTGEPDKVLNINLKKDKNYGYFAQATAGLGKDAQPHQENDVRSVGSLNTFFFKGETQLSVLGNINNTNVNTFTFGSGNIPSVSGNRSGGGDRQQDGKSGGGGGSSGSSGQSASGNGINTVRTIGVNYRDQWGKFLSVYGSYSFADNSIYTTTDLLQQNNTAGVQTLSRQQSVQTSNPLNHRFTWNFEYRPDNRKNYLKISPTLMYGRTITDYQDSVLSSRNGITNLQYLSTSYTRSAAPNYGIAGVFSHRFNEAGRNFSISANVNTTDNSTFEHPMYNYIVGSGTVPASQQLQSDYRITTKALTFSYTEPLSKRSFLEFNYTYSRIANTNDNVTDTLDGNNNHIPYYRGTYTYDYTFITHRTGLNFRFIEKKYSYVIGLSVLPATLDGEGTGYDLSEHFFATATRRTALKFIPSVRFNYGASRNKSFGFNYNGFTNQPLYTQIAPGYIFTDALNPVEGNPELEAEFTNSFSMKYNKFNPEAGDLFLAGLSFSSVDNKIATNAVVYPVKFSPTVMSQHPELRNLQNTTVYRYLNTDGYYTASANVLFSKPWNNRKYTLILSGSASLSNNIGYSGSVDSNNVASGLAKIITKTLNLAPLVRFRVDLPEKINAELSSSYAINNSNNSSQNSEIVFQNANIRTWTMGVNTKIFVLKDWTLSADFTKAINYNYAVAVTNPAILNMYAERWFGKNHSTTIRLQGFDLFNQNTGYSVTTAGNVITQSAANRLGRYFLCTFTFKLQKFAGKQPSTENRPPKEEGRYNDGPGGAGQKDH